MAKSTITFDTVREIGLALPGVEESTAYGSPALKVRKKIMACMAINRSAEPGSLGVWVDCDDRVELLAADPDVFYVTDHYAPYNVVLVRLSRVKRDVLRDTSAPASPPLSAAPLGRRPAARARPA